MILVWTCSVDYGLVFYGRFCCFDAWFDWFLLLGWDSCLLGLLSIALLVLVVLDGIGFDCLIFCCVWFWFVAGCLGVCFNIVYSLGLSLFGLLFVFWFGVGLILGVVFVGLLGFRLDLWI